MSFYNGYLTNIDIAANPFSYGYYGQPFMPFGRPYYGGFGSLSMLGRLGLFGMMQNSMRSYSLQNYLMNETYLPYNNMNYIGAASYTTPYGIESYGSNYMQPNNYSYQYGAIGGIGDSFVSNSSVSSETPYSYINNSFVNGSYSNRGIANSYVRRVSGQPYNINRNIPTNYTGYRTSATGTGNVSNPAYVTGTTNVQYGTKDLNFWKNLGYNPENAQKMVNNIKTEKRGKNVSGQCGKVVRHAINSTYYGGQEHYKQFHKACNTGDEFLSKDGNFRKYVPNGTISAADIPPGAIIIYRGDTGNGQKGYVKGDPRGHIAVATGDGVHDESNRYTKIKTDCIKEIWLPA